MYKFSETKSSIKVGVVVHDPLQGKMFFIHQQYIIYFLQLRTSIKTPLFCTHVYFKSSVVSFGFMLLCVCFVFGVSYTAGQDFLTSYKKPRRTDIYKNQEGCKVELGQHYRS